MYIPYFSELGLISAPIVALLVGALTIWISWLNYKRELARLEFEKEVKLKELELAIKQFELDKEIKLAEIKLKQKELEKLKQEEKKEIIIPKK